MFLISADSSINELVKFGTKCSENEEVKTDISSQQKKEDVKKSASSIVDTKEAAATVGSNLHHTKNKLDAIDTSKSNVDDGTLKNEIERPPPPISPSKFNRARIKAVPRLGHQRKTSFSMHGSASESEDDNGRRLTTRNRNDSVS